MCMKNRKPINDETLEALLVDARTCGLTRLQSEMLVEELIRLRSEVEVLSNELDDWRGVEHVSR